MIRFTLLGIPVSIQPAVLLTLSLLGWVFAVETAPVWLCVALFAVAGFICLLSHEMGHALVGRMLGGGNPRVVVSWLGGDCCNADGVFTRMQGVVMTAAGPLFTLLEAGVATLLLCLLCGNVQDGLHLAHSAIFGKIPEAYLAAYSPSLLLFAAYMVQVGFWWAVINLLPIFPLDGGQIMHGLMDSPRLMHVISLSVAIICMLFCMAMGFWLMIIFLGFLAYLNYRCLWFTSH
ncbi:MAG: site-2 protease family protein [Akkermansia sp.]|nr:site-2 protease family protein [Akkermansia sp.]